MFSFEVEPVVLIISFVLALILFNLRPTDPPTQVVYIAVPQAERRGGAGLLLGLLIFGALIAMVRSTVGF